MPRERERERALRDQHLALRLHARRRGNGLDEHVLDVEHQTHVEIEHAAIRMMFRVYETRAHGFDTRGIE